MFTNERTKTQFKEKLKVKGPKHTFCFGTDKRRSYKSTNVEGKKYKNMQAYQPFDTICLI